MRDDLEGRFNDYIIETTVAEFDKPAGRFSPVVDNILKRVQLERQSEVGALTAGDFWLTPTARAYTLYVYCPTGHTGKIYYKLSGVTDNKYVEFVTPPSGTSNGSRKKIDLVESKINLGKCERAKGGTDAQDIEDVPYIETPQELKDLRGITFQLVGQDVDAAATGKEAPAISSGVEVSYISIVTPAIHIEK